MSHRATPARADLPVSPVVAAGLVGGYCAARFTGVRALGGVVLAAAGGLSWSTVTRAEGPVAAGAVTGVYTAGFIASHPLAKRIGPWPSVAVVAAASAATAYALHDQHL